MDDERDDQRARGRLTTMVFLEINRALGQPPPNADDTEYGFERFLIARAAADEFWDWIAGRPGVASNARVFTQIMDAAVAKARETTSGREAGTRREALGRRPRPTPRARSRLGSGPEPSELWGVGWARGGRSVGGRDTNV